MVWQDCIATGIKFKSRTGTYYKTIINIIHHIVDKQDVVGKRRESKEQRDGRKEGRRDGRTERRRDGGTDGRRDGGTEGRRDGGTDGRRDGGTGGRGDGGTGGRKDGGAERKDVMQQRGREKERTIVTRQRCRNADRL